MSTPPLLETENLTIRRDGQTILDAVSLSVTAGSIHAVIGPNGAGKSSLLAAVLGQTLFSGAIRCHFRGTGKIGFVPQRFPVDRTLPITVEELLAVSRQRLPVCLGIQKRTRQIIADLLSRVGLQELATRRLGALSGGELQRVLLANALDPTPELLLLDEPAAGLDAPSVQRLEDILSALRDTSNTTVLLVSHDLRQVRRLCDRVTLLCRSVEREGTPAEVLAALEER